MSRENGKEIGKLGNELKNDSQSGKQKTIQARSRLRSTKYFRVNIFSPSLLDKYSMDGKGGCWSHWFASEQVCLNKDGMKIELQKEICQIWVQVVCRYIADCLQVICRLFTDLLLVSSHSRFPVISALKKNAGWTDGMTEQWTDPYIEMRGRI